MNRAHTYPSCIQLNEEAVSIVADDREQKSVVIESLRGIANVSVCVERLASGDYLADHRILFERKTLQDLARSIVDGRLFKQMVRLAKSKYKMVGCSNRWYGLQNQNIKRF